MADLTLFNRTCKTLGDLYGRNRGCNQDVINGIIHHLTEIERLYQTLPVLPEKPKRKRKTERSI